MRMIEFKSGNASVRLGQLDDFLSDVNTNVSAGHKARDNNPADLKWRGGVSLAVTTRKCHDGDLDLATQSEKLLAEIEAMLPPPTARHAIINDVTGSFPDVPAMLAGHPLAMRRKAKRENENAPVAIVADLNAGSNATSKQMLKRGLAVLALVRATAAVRPVELWIGASAMHKDGMTSLNCYFQVPTSPIDLARASHLIAAPGITRQMLHGLLFDMGGADSLPFAYNDGAEGFRKIATRMFPAMDAVTAVPILDTFNPEIVDMLDNPAQWVAGCVKTLSAEDIEQEDAA